MKTAAVVVLLSLCCLSGCNPRTIVKKDPGPYDRGVRYYRPKPYLFVKPTIANNAPIEGYVTLEQLMLPDFSEEYSIHIRTGLGTNDTAILLDQGWNLTSLNVKLDSQFDENLKAIAEVAKAIPTAGVEQQGIRMAVRATNVPMGLYEAVISRGPDGKKRLYGFRYVGFMPYALCPLDSCGAEQQNCYETVIYGLVFQGGAMVFTALQEIPEQLDLSRVSVHEEPRLEGDQPEPITQPALDERNLEPR